MMMRKIGAILVVILALCFIESCGKRPLPCFMTNPEEDNIHVNQPITFSAYCSNNGEEFFWEFYDNEDSIEFDPVLVKYFKDTGTVSVSLTAINGNKSAIYKKSITVKP